MKWLIILIFLAGCAHKQPIPVKPQEFPQMSDKVKHKCPDLIPAPNSELLSDLIGTVTKNYGEYHKCKATVDAWNQWYDEQKANYEKVKK